jgi:hypothetical protein
MSLSEDFLAPALIGSCLVFSGDYEDVLRRVPARAFGDRALRDIWATMQRLASAGLARDPAIVMAKCPEWSGLVPRCLAASPIPSHCEVYADLLLKETGTAPAVPKIPALRI